MAERRKIVTAAITITGGGGAVVDDDDGNNSNNINNSYKKVLGFNLKCFGKVDDLPLKSRIGHQKIIGVLCRGVPLATEF